MRRLDGSDDLARRFTGLRVTALQVDPSWYERHWLRERGSWRPGVLAMLVSRAAAAAPGVARLVSRMVPQPSSAAPARSPTV